MISLDRRQGHFSKTFEEFGAPRIAARMAQGARHDAEARRAAVAHRAAVWRAGRGRDRDLGARNRFRRGQGKQSALRALATLAHDCRRTERFQNELLDALRIIDRGDLSPAEMRGAWAGELGQTQFLPSSYLKFAVDFDGNGKRDLIRSVPDVLASTANYLRGYGWQRGGRFSEGTPNYAVLKEWNKSAVYQKTIAVFASRLMGLQ